MFTMVKDEGIEILHINERGRRLGLKIIYIHSIFFTSYNHCTLVDYITIVK